MLPYVVNLTRGEVVGEGDTAAEVYYNILFHGVFTVYLGGFDL